MAKAMSKRKKTEETRAERKARLAAKLAGRRAMGTHVSGRKSKSDEAERWGRG